MALLFGACMGRRDQGEATVLSKTQVREVVDDVYGLTLPALEG